jgi:hypothetical protein
VIGVLEFGPFVLFLSIKQKNDCLALEATHLLKIKRNILF